MKLFYSFGACSLAPHILLRELEIPHIVESVDLPGQKYGKAKSAEFKKINSKGKVPALVLENGEVLTECAVILEYLSDLRPDRGFFPPSGTFERYRAREWTNFIATDLQKNVVVLLNRLTASTHREQVKAWLSDHLGSIDQHLKTKGTLLGGAVSAADLYLFVVLTWLEHVDIKIENWPHIAKFFDSISKRPSVLQALKVESLP